MNNLKKTKIGGGKSLRLILLLFLLLGNVGVWAEDKTLTFVFNSSEKDVITGNDLGTAYTFHRWTVSNNDVTVYLGGKNGVQSKLIAMRYAAKYTGEMFGNIDPTYDDGKGYNIPTGAVGAIPGRIKNISVVCGGTTSRGIYVYAGTKQIVGDETAPNGTGFYDVKSTKRTGANVSVDYDASTDYRYFAITGASSSYSAISSVTITYEGTSTPSITASDVTYAADKLKGEIPYTINNGEADAEITASSTTSWIHNVDVDAANNKVTFDMSKNTETTPRYGVVTIKYTKGETVVPQNVTVTQEGFKEKYTVTFADDGSSLSEETGGAGITLPTRTDVAPYTFKGWTTVDLLVETTEEPTIYSGKYNPESNITLYPVYVRIEDSGLKNVNVSTTIADYAATNGWSDGVKYTSLVLDDNISISAIGSSNTGKYYKTDNSWRFYSSETAKLKVTASEGATLTSVTLTFTGKSSSEPATVKYNGTEIKTDESVSVSGSTVEFDVTGGQARVSAIAVVYTTGSSTSYYTSHPVAPTTATITLSEACKDADSFYYGTYSNSKPFVVSDDIIVSEISVIDGKLLIDEYNPGDIVPANTGVMVSSDVAGDHTVNLSKEAGTSILGENNMLRPTGDTGITADEMAAADANCKYYRLTMHKGTTLGFFYGAEDGAAFNVAANKAYLAVPQEIAQKIQSFVIGDGGTTSIDGITTDGSENAQRTVYNLQGQRVNPDAAHGLYIVNGKKVIIR